MPRELKPLQVTQPDKETGKADATKEPSAKHADPTHPSKATSLTDPPANLRPTSRADAVKFPTVTALPPNPHSDKTVESTKALVEKERPAKPRAEKVHSSKPDADDSSVTKEPATNSHPDKPKSAKAEPEKASKVKDAVDSGPEKMQAAKMEKGSKTKPMDSRSEKVETVKAETEKASKAKEPAASTRSEKAQTAKAESEKGSKTKEPDARSEKVETAKAETEKASKVKEPAANNRSEKAQTAKAESEKGSKKKETAVRSEKVETAKAETEKASKVKEPAASTRSEKAQTAKVGSDKGSKTKEADARSEKVETAKVEPERATQTKEPAANSRSEKAQLARTEPVKAPASKEPTVSVRSEKSQTGKAAQGDEVPEPNVDVQMSNRSIETASTKLADGFDFPVGKPEAEGYYKARGFRSGGHVGEDWDGVRGGDTDLKDPIYCIGSGVVVFARDVHRGWGNVVIVRHAFREGGTVKHIDSLYGHLHAIMVKRGQRVARGQQVGTMGTAHGRYDAHLHLEIRKNLEIGMSRAKFQKTFSNYYDPSDFIESHRHLSGGGESFRVAMNTFTHDAAFHFDDPPSGAMRKHRGLIGVTR